jgi:hypothetical protein
MNEDFNDVWLSSLMVFLPLLTPPIRYLTQEEGKRPEIAHPVALSKCCSAKLVVVQICYIGGLKLVWNFGRLLDMNEGLIGQRRFQLEQLRNTHRVGTQFNRKVASSIKMKVK